MTVGKPLRIRFGKVDGFIRAYLQARYLLLFGAEKHNFIYHRIRYLIGIRSDTYVICHSYAKIKVVSYDSLRLEKIMYHVMYCYVMLYIVCIML